MPSGSALTILTATASGDRAVFAHGPSGDVLDTETFAPIAGARYDIASTVATPDGRDVLVTDSGNFQSVLFSFDRDEPSYFPGRSLAVDDDARRHHAERRDRGEHHRVRPRRVVGDRRSRAVGPSRR